MQGMGSGVDWTDRHATFPVRVPHTEEGLAEETARGWRYFSLPEIYSRTSA